MHSRPAALWRELGGMFGREASRRSQWKLSIALCDVPGCRRSDVCGRRIQTGMGVCPRKSLKICLLGRRSLTPWNNLTRV
jgi:hypothetical protein